jgi:hypothetical protein
MQPSMSSRSQAVPSPAADDPTQERLEDQITYRSTAEALKHGLYLYLGHPDRAGPCTLPCSWIGQVPSPPGSRVVHRPRAAGPALTA